MTLEDFNPQSMASPTPIWTLHAILLPSSTMYLSQCKSYFMARVKWMPRRFRDRRLLLRQHRGIVLFQLGTSEPSASSSIDQANRLAELMSLSKAREC